MATLIAKSSAELVEPELEALAAMLFYIQQEEQAEKTNFANWEEWHTAIFGEPVFAFGEHHREFWRHVWDIKGGERPRPFAAFWSRGGAKSTSVERGCVAVAANKTRRYALYVSATQEQADKHVESVGAVFESPRLSEYYPEVGRRAVGKYGSSKGWRRNRLRTESGFTIDALGLDVAGRGIRVEDQRPDLIILDDIDEETDSEDQVDKKIKIIASKVLPSGSFDCAVIFVQNLIHEGSVADRLDKGKTDILSDCIISGPYPALENFDYTEKISDDGRTTYEITAGDPVWEGQSVEICQNYINTFGLMYFLSECQHVMAEPQGGLFNHINFRHCAAEEVPQLIYSEVWVDPAVSSTDKSDSHGISAGGKDINDILYITHSWEGISTPGASIRRAIDIALITGATYVGVETDQGGDLWEETYRLICEEYERKEEYRGVILPQFKSAKAGSSQMSKAHRVSTMVPAYERGEIVHVLNGTGHQVIRERALKRFPLVKPFDLVDSGWHLWNSLVGVRAPVFGVSAGGEKGPLATIVPIRSDMEMPFAPVMDRTRIRR